MGSMYRGHVKEGVDGGQTKKSLKRIIYKTRVVVNARAVNELFQSTVRRQ